MASAGAGASDEAGSTIFSFFNCCTPKSQAGTPAAQPTMMTLPADAEYVVCVRARLLQACRRRRRRRCRRCRRVATLRTLLVTPLLGENAGPARAFLFEACPQSTSPRKVSHDGVRVPHADAAAAAAVPNSLAVVRPAPFLAPRTRSPAHLCARTSWRLQLRPCLPCPERRDRPEDKAPSHRRQLQQRLRLRERPLP